MPPIRALPWTNVAELAQLYAWIWEEPEDEVSTARAVARIATYLPHPSTPLFLPLLHSLLTTRLLAHPPTTPQQLLATRLALSSTLIRFVNSLVDPLQTTAYAKPIALLARQLKIPQTLVAVRHAATHEDLPTYEALRAGVEQAVEWIRVEVMAPLVFPQNTSTDGDAFEENGNDEKETQEYLALVKKYKSLLRAFYRERTSTNTALWSGARDLRMTLRAVEDKLEVLASREGGKREEQARWLARRILFAERGGLVPNARKRPHWNPSVGFPHPGEAETRIWTPLLALIADKCSADAEGEGRERYDDDENDEAEGWSTWCLSEGVRLVLQYIETRDTRLQRSSPSTTQSAGLKRKRKGAEVVPFAHDADYLGLPDEVEEEDGEERTAVAGIEGVGTEDVELQEKEEFIACLVGWLAFFLGGSSSSTTANNTTNVRAGNNTTTGKRRRSGQLGDSLPLEIVAGAAQDSGAAAWTVGPRGRRSVVKELVKRLDVDVVKGAWEMSVQEIEDGQEERIEAHKLVRKEDLLLLLIRGDPVCEALVRQLAEADEAYSQDQQLPDGNAEKQELDGMEHRLEAFRKMMMQRQGQISLQRQSTDISTEVDDHDAIDGDGCRKKMRGWARVDGWKECPIGYWRS